MQQLAAVVVVVFFFCLSLTLPAAEFKVGNAALQAVISQRGAALRSLQYRERALTVADTASFTDKLLSRENDKTQTMERFTELPFRVVALSSDSITLSAIGRAAFNWLRLSKTYSFPKDQDSFKVTYRLENLTSQEQSAGFWTQSFLRRDDGFGMANSYCHVVDGQLQTLQHPGSAVTGDAWSINPPLAWQAVYGTDNYGAVVFYPPELLCSYYSWLSPNKDSATLEWFLREQPLAAHASLEFSLKVECSSDTPALLAQPALAELRSGPASGRQTLLPLFYSEREPDIKSVQPALGPRPSSEHYFDLSGKRQFNDSVRAALIPAEVPYQGLNVYQLHNEQAEIDRPVPFLLEKQANGDTRVMVLVPGLNEFGFYHTSFQDGHAFCTRRQNLFLGEDTFSYRIVLDADQTAAQLETLSNEPDIVYNGDFEKQATWGEWPDGYRWSYDVQNRNLFFWADGQGFQGGKAIKIVHPQDSKHWSIFTCEFRPEANVRYQASCAVKCDNLELSFSTATIEFLDADKKKIAGADVRLQHDKETYDWRTPTQSFFAPKGAAYGNFRFSIYHHNQTMYVDKLKIVPEDFTYYRKKRREVLRQELLGSRYRTLEILEDLRSETVTPHTPWFKPAAEPLTGILYLPLGQRRTVQDTERRQILEFAQRHDLQYEYLPLLRRISNISANGWAVDFADDLEEYTLECLREITAPPRLVIVQALDLEKQVQPEFLQILRHWQDAGSALFFYNCPAIPAELLGDLLPLPGSVLTIPILRDLSPKTLARVCQFYQRGASRVAVFNRNNEWYYEANRFFPCVPAERTGELAPAHYSREFPYWEYMYLSILKSLRWTAGISPQLAVVSQQDTTLQIEASAAAAAELRVVVKDFQRQIQGENSQPINCPAGISSLALPLPPGLPGGTHIAEYWLLDAQSQVIDCGALYFTTPETCPISLTFADPDRVFSYQQQVQGEITLASVPAGAELYLSVEDIDGRIVFQQQSPAQAQQQFAFKLHFPYSTLNRLFVQVRLNEQTLSSTMQEFSLEKPAKDPYDLDALIWVGRHEFTKIVRDLGFSMSISQYQHNCYSNGMYRNYLNLGLEPVTYGSGSILNRTSLTYRGDKESDPVREPCFSDQERWQKVREYCLNKAQESRFRYYDIKNHFIADEAFLGSQVCYAEPCLRDFRLELQKQYPSLPALNQGWGSDFASWDSVTPQQLSELANPENLSPWLDHKLFMAGVFAHQWVGNTLAILAEARPGSMGGLSGTQVPGYSYDWLQLMKHINFLSYYSGVQCQVIHDFAPANFIGGQWGGYSQAYDENQLYQTNIIWHDLFRGANLLCNFCGHGIIGDLRPTHNLQYYSELLKECQRGLAKIILSSSAIMRDVSIVYSQPALFAAIGSIGGNLWQNSQTGWVALLDDLQFGSRFISYEDLDNGKISGKVLILPCTLTLSPAAVRHLRQFVENGGLLLADFAPGWYDQHGRKNSNPELAELFGIDRQAAELSTQAQTLQSQADAVVGIPALQGAFRLGESGLTLTASARACATAGSADSASPAWIVRPLGQGQVILLNCLVSGYQNIDLGGVGGETSTVKSDSALFCEQLRLLCRGILAQAGIRPNSHITDSDGRVFPCQAILRQDGENYVFGLLQSQSRGRRLEDFPATALQVQLPIAGHIYDIRQGTYLGQGNSFNTALRPADAQLFSILPTKVGALSITAPASIKAGQTVTLRFHHQDASGAQIYRLEIRAPDGQPQPRLAQNQRCQNGSGEFTVQIAHNAPPGLYTADIINVNSGLRTTHTLAVL